MHKETIEIMNLNTKKIRQSIEQAKTDFPEWITQFDSSIEIADWIIDKIKTFSSSDNEFSINYASLVRELVNNLTHLSNKKIDDVNSLFLELVAIKSAFEVVSLLQIISRNSNTIILVGANGSGKSSLVNYLDCSIFNNLWVLPAQKVLYTFESPANVSLNSNEYHDSHKKHLNIENMKNISNLSQLVDFSKGFSLLISTLVNEHAQLAVDEREVNCIDHETSKLEQVKSIWKEIIEDIELLPQIGIRTLKVRKNGNEYKINELSDGEKSILYYIGNVLLAPENSYIVVDEPETYLNPAIYNILWDMLIERRPDCQFIFSSHTMEFITARSDFTIAWCKKFDYPNKFEIEILDDTEEMPVDVAIELLGNKKPVIFCEGTLSSLDYKVYNSIFKNDFLIKPVGGHNEVIDFTRVYNKMDAFDKKAFGIIDRDFHDDDYINHLRNENIYVTKFNEIEMLLIDKKVIEETLAANFEPNEVKEKIQKFESYFFKISNNQLDRISSQYTKKKIEQKFHNFIVEKFTGSEDLNSTFETFIESIDFKLVNDTMQSTVRSAIEDKNYESLLGVCNLKEAIVPGMTNKYLDSNYHSKVIFRIKDSVKLNNYIRSKYFKEFFD